MNPNDPEHKLRGKMDSRIHLDEILPNPRGEEHRIKQERHGSQTFYALLDTAANLHDKKSHDYASNDAPSGNYHFAGLLANLFSHSSQDAGFIGRIGEKVYRLANLEKAGKTAKNESIEDTELDLVVLMCLWVADRRDRRSVNQLSDATAHDDHQVHIKAHEMEQERLRFEKETKLRPGEENNPLQTELLDLIKLMPDSQTDDIMEFIISLRQARRKHKSTDA